MGLKEDVGKRLTDAATEALAIQHQSGDIVEVSRVLTDRMAAYVKGISDSLLLIVTEVERLADRKGE